MRFQESGALVQHLAEHRQVLVPALAHAGVLGALAGEEQHHGPVGGLSGVLVGEARIAAAERAYGRLAVRDGQYGA